MEGAVFGLLGLLIAFTFSGAATRFDWRRDLIVREANDVGTAYLRLDLLPASHQPALREMFRKYVDLRLETYADLAHGGDVYKDLERTARLQAEIWSAAVAACEGSSSAPVTTLVLPSLNSMFDIITTRRMAAATHPPVVIFVMLSGLALIGALLAGFGMAGGKTRSWIHILCFAAIMATTVYVILDLEYPRRGLIRIDGADKMLLEVRQSMK